MKLVTSSEMRDLDRRAIEGGMPGCVLMENAGRAVAREARALLSSVRGSSVYVACGTGNNGGDGFVAARHLALAGVSVTVGVSGNPDGISGDAATNYRLIQSMGVEVLQGCGWLELLELQAHRRSAGHARSPAVVVDALLGTGSHGEPRGAVAEAIEAITRSGLPVVAVDVPSGVDADTGRVAAAAVKADVTVTFGFPKPGLVMYPGAGYAGRIVVDQIGYDWSLAERREAPEFEWFDADLAQRALPVRLAESHKGDYGHVLIVGGSEGMSGAPSLAAMGALRSGAGLVTIAVPRCIHGIVATRVAEAMCLPLPDRDGAVSPEATSVLESALDRATVVCVGPGLSRSEGAAEVVRWLLRHAAVPVVVDADALAAVASEPDLTCSRQAATVLTPHPGECSRLLGRPTAAVQGDRLAAVREAAERFGATVVLKGAHSMVCAPGVEAAEGHDAASGRTAVITAGNPGMATGGSGDVLTGVIGAMLAQHLDAYTAAALGVYAHARAGDLAAHRRGEHGLVAGDIADAVSAALRELVAGYRREEQTLDGNR